MIVIVIFLLSALLGLVPYWIAELIRNRPVPMPPATDADEEAADEDADALPFGPAPRDAD